mmetsp:Transcript_40668/g.100982  ORF Transcript_40668/g.100982 Transcript_40668/m.100982 type:complete len:360 (-) Transcript_40668:384-1463(-)
MKAKYEVLSMLGEGAYGVVYKAKDNAPDRLVGGPQFVAMKKVRMDEYQKGLSPTMLREVGVLRRLQHENIVRLVNVIRDSPNLWLVFDHMDYDLKQYMDVHYPHGMPDEQIKACVQQILKGVAFCHSHLVLHRDLKPQNVLIDQRNGQVKLADFGLARPFQASQKVFTNEVVTLWYRAPEILLGQKEYTAAVDMWSIGCIFAELVTHKPLFPGDSEINELLKIFQCLGTPSPDDWPGVRTMPRYLDVYERWTATDLKSVLPRMHDNAVRLLARMLALWPDHRLKAQAALQDEYFDSMREQSPGRNCCEGEPPSASTPTDLITVSASTECQGSEQGDSDHQTVGRSKLRKLAQNSASTGM